MPRLPKVKKLVVMSDRSVPQTGSLSFEGEYEALLAASSPDYLFPDFDENTQATTFYTSGTTGLPKGVYYSHRQVVLHCLSELAFLGLAGKHGRFSRDDVYMPMTPMFHVHAWGFPWAATLAGVKQVYPGRYHPELLVRLIKTEGVTFTHGVPTLLEMLLNAAGAAKAHLGELKMIIGGSELHKALAKQAVAAGIDVCAGFGMSETGPIVAAAQVMTKDLGDPERELDIRVRAGITAPLVEARIVGQDMKDLPHDGETAGELVLRSVAHARLRRQSRSVRSAMGRWIPAHRRHRRHHAGWLHPDYRPNEGCHQERRRMGVIRADRRLDRAVSRREGSRRHRNPG